MTAAEKIFEDFIGDAVGYGLVKYSVIEAIKHAIQLGNDEVLQTTIDASDEIQALRTRLAELEKENQELREGIFTGKRIDNGEMVKGYYAWSMGRHYITVVINKYPSYGDPGGCYYEKTYEIN
jgi:hypothetical protein